MTRNQLLHGESSDEMINLALVDLDYEGTVQGLTMEVLVQNDVLDSNNIVVR